MRRQAFYNDRMAASVSLPLTQLTGFGAVPGCSGWFASRTQRETRLISVSSFISSLDLTSRIEPSNHSRPISADHCGL